MFRIIIVTPLDANVVDNNADTFNLNHVELSFGLFKSFSGSLSTPYYKNNPIDFRAQDDGIRERQKRRRIKKDVIEVLFHGIDQAAHFVRHEQLNGVWGHRPGVNQINVGNLRRFYQVFGVMLGTQVVRQTIKIFDFENFMLSRFPQVRVNYQDPFPGLGKSDGQV